MSNPTDKGKITDVEVERFVRDAIDPLERILNREDWSFLFDNVKDAINNALLAASRVRTAEPVAVKPLEWESIGPSSMWASLEEWWVTYRISLKVDGSKALRIERLGNRNDDLGVFAEWDQAKAAAQADYEARILSALVPSPPTGEVAEGFVLVPREPTEAMVEAFIGEAQSQGVAFDEFSPPIYPAKLYRAMIAAAPSPTPQPDSQGDGWQDISTVPRDGTWVELRTPLQPSVRAHWAIGSLSEDPDDEGWVDDVAFWVLEEGEQPTHWRLPAPPAIQQGA